MNYRAVNYRCAVILDSLELPMTNQKALKILKDKGYKIIDIDLITLARKCIGQSKYKRGARLAVAPEIVDCSSLMKWLYGQLGIWIPRRSIQQRAAGEIVKLKEIIAGDLIFASGCIDYYDNNPADGVGHVGIATGDGTVIHAANKKLNVVESSIESFIGKDKFRGARRFIPKEAEVLTLETPKDREIEMSDDLKWIILQTL